METIILSADLTNRSPPFSAATRPSRFAARPLHQFLGHHAAAHLIGDGDGRAQRRVGKRDDEFLAAVAGDDIPAFDVVLHRHGDETEHLVTCEVAEPVVELFEPL